MVSGGSMLVGTHTLSAMVLAKNSRHDGRFDFLRWGPLQFLEIASPGKMFPSINNRLMLPSQLSQPPVPRPSPQRTPLMLHPRPIRDACPGRALPCYTLLRTSAPGCCGTLGTPPSPRARDGRQRATLGCPRGVFRGCAPEGPALQCPLNFLYSPPQDMAR
jgi:hypothetical protein